MIALLALLLLTSPAWGQVTVQNVTVQNVTIGIAGTTAPNDWTGSMVALWLMEESSGTRYNETDTTCGTSGCDLAVVVGNPGSNTTDPIQGSASALFAQSNNDGLRCPTDASNCDELEATGGIVSWGCWAKPGATATLRQGLGAQSGYTDGYLFRILGNDNIMCGIGDGTDWQEVAKSGLVEGEWGHFACTYSDDSVGGDDTVRNYYNAATPTTITQQSVSGSTIYFTMGTGDSGTWEGSVDECWVVLDVVLSQAQIAHIAACGVDGSDCLCNGATYSTKGKVDSSCNGTDDPWPCCTGSGTGCIDDALLTGDCNAAAP